MGRTNEFGYLGAGPDQTASANTGVFNFTEVNNLTSDGAFATAGSTDIIELLVVVVVVVCRFHSSNGERVQVVWCRL